MEIKKVAVLGSGTMGAGIAQWFAQNNILVALVDVHLAQAQAAQQKILSQWQQSCQKGKITAAEVKNWSQHLMPQELQQVDPHCNLVIEAIVEDLASKRELLAKLDQYFATTTIFATNTSSFSISLLGSTLSPERKKNFLGLHFFNPAPVLKLVEVIQGQATDSSLPQQLAHWLQEKGKVPAICQDRPGFIVNRVARNFYGEPMRIAGSFDRQQFTHIDSVLKKVGGFKMGPFELMDFIGIDVNYTVTQSLWSAFFYHPRFAPHFLQQQLFHSEKLGRKSGEGFYSYE